MLFSLILIAATPLGAVGSTATSIEAGYPRLPRVAVTFVVAPRFRVGAAGSFDASHFSYATSAAMSAAGGVSIPMVITAVESPSVEWTFSLELGAMLVAAPAIGFGLQLAVGTEIKGRMSHALALGVALDIPMSLLVAPSVYVTAPILVGPAFYAQLSETTRLFVRAQAGPGLSTLSLLGVAPYFALLATAGAAFAL